MTPLTSRRRAGVLLAAALAVMTMPRASGRTLEAPVPVAGVDSVGFTVSDMDRAIEFYTRVLTFAPVSDVEVAGREFELLSGVFGARARVVRLRLGDEQIELTEFRAPRGRPIPADVHANDRGFQHVAIIVRDMDAAYRRLREYRVGHASTGPQRLPDWNVNAGGIEAFYFRDPDGHFLEVLEFPKDKGLAKWHAPGEALFMGIDHTAIVVGDTDAALRLYRDTLGLSIAGEAENYDTEQEHLNNVFGARLRITALRAPAGPGIELLEYLAPQGGRPPDPDLRANDIAHWQITLSTPALDGVLPLARAHRLALVSPGPVGLATVPLGFGAGVLTRDADGHGLRLVSR